MICPKCGREVSNNDEFCMYCGATLKTTTEEQKMYCSKCGAPVNISDDFCAICGSKIKKNVDDLDLDLSVKTTEKKKDEEDKDLISFVGYSKYYYYKEKFREVDINKFSFNVCAFLFGPFWCFYRRLFACGGICIAALSLFSLAERFINNIIVSIIFSTIQLIVWCSFGFIGNLFYKKNYDKTLAQAEGKTDEQKDLLLKTNGNPSGLLILVPIGIFLVLGMIEGIIWPKSTEAILNFNNIMNVFNVFLRSR